MKQETEQRLSLLPGWTFVVQFRAGTGVEHDQVEGRVAHVVSGQATRFHSLEELLTFMARALTIVRAPPSPENSSRLNLPFGIEEENRLPPKGDIQRLLSATTADKVSRRY